MVAAEGTADGGVAVGGTSVAVVAGMAAGAGGQRVEWEGWTGLKRREGGGEGAAPEEEGTPPCLPVGAAARGVRGMGER